MVYKVENGNAAAMIPMITQMINKALWRGAVEVVLQRPGRSLSQNSKLWPMLNDIQKQIDWYGHQLTSEDWKDVFTAALRRQRAVPGIDGGFVALGMRTSKMEKKAFSELIELIYAFGCERNVTWSEPALSIYSTYKEAA